MMRGDEATERGLSIHSAAPDAGVSTNFALSAEAARLDVQPDEVGISCGCVTFISFCKLTLKDRIEILV